MTHFQRQGLCAAIACSRMTRAERIIATELVRQGGHSSRAKVYRLIAIRLPSPSERCKALQNLELASVLEVDWEARPVRLTIQPCVEEWGVLKREEVVELGMTEKQQAGNGELSDA